MNLPTGSFWEKATQGREVGVCPQHTDYHVGGREVDYSKVARVSRRTASHSGTDTHAHTFPVLRSPTPAGEPEADTH